MNHLGKIIKASALAVGILLFGCIKLWPDEVLSLKEAEIDIGLQEGIMIVFNSEFSYKEFKREVTNEDDIINCVTDEIKAARPGQRIIPFDEFRRIAYPDLPPEAAPKKPRFLQKLLERPGFMERIAPFNLRYIVFVKGASEAGMVVGPVTLGPFFGIMTEVNRQTHLKAFFWDLKGQRTTGEAQASTSGTVGWYHVGMLPFFFSIAPTETITCSSLGQELVNLLAGGKPSNSENEEK